MLSLVSGSLVCAFVVVLSFVFVGWGEGGREEFLEGPFVPLGLGCRDFGLLSSPRNRDSGFEVPLCGRQ